MWVSVCVCEGVFVFRMTTLTLLRQGQQFPVFQEPLAFDVSCH